MEGEKYGNVYEGERDFESLKTFADERLYVACNLHNLETCNDKEKGYILKMSGKTKSERQKERERLQKMGMEGMKSELRTWIKQRLHILQTLQ